MKKERKISLANIFIGTAFLAAALYRIFYPDAGIDEISRLGLHYIFLWLIILFEITIGVMFILAKKVKIASLLAIGFLISAIIIGFLSNFDIIVSSLGELFVFGANPTDILLHIVYIGILIYILKKN